MEKVKNELVSIIIPIYNVEKYIHGCINSVLAQTYTNIEIILVDDGSPDNCPAICDEYAKTDSRIRVIHKQNGGLSDARNVGIDAATGEYIVFIDSDDEVSSDYVEYLYDMIQKCDEALISVCGVMQVQQNQKPYKDTHSDYRIYTTEQILENMLYAKGVEICSYAKMYRKSVFTNLKFPVGHVYEDSATTYLFLEKSPKIVFGTRRCYYYYTRPGSISKLGAFNKNEHDYIVHTKQMLNYLSEKYPSLQKAIDRYYVYSKFRTLRMLVYSSPRDKKFEREIINEIKLKRRSVFFDKNVPDRDKIAILTSLFGREVYKVCWYIYCRMTGRLVY